MQAERADLDPDVKLPRAVRDRSERIRLKLEGDQQQQSPPQPAPTPAPPVAAAPSDQPPVATASDVQGDPPAAPSSSEPSEPGLEKGAEYWMNRYKTVAGLRNAERNRLTDRIVQLETELRAARQTIEAFEAEKADAAPIDLLQFYTQEQIDQFGEETLRVMLAGSMRASRAQLQQELEKREAPVRESQQRQQQSEQQRKDAEFKAAIAAIVPDWEAINNDAEFLEWLAGEDPETGFERNVLLQRAHMRFDSNRAARFFTDFKAATGRPTTPAAAPSPSVLPSGGVAGGATAANGQPPTAWIPSEKEIRQHYADRARKRTTPAQEKAFEEGLRARDAALNGR